jgi:hypothetical protein
MEKLSIFQQAIQCVGSTHAEERHGKNRKEGISPTKTSNTDLKTWRGGDRTRGPGLVIAQRICEHEEVLAEWWEDEDKLFIPHARSKRQELPMDAIRRSSGRQLAARAPCLPVASFCRPVPLLPAGSVESPWFIILVKNKRTTTHQACIHPIPIFRTLIKTINF